MAPKLKIAPRPTDMTNKQAEEENQVYYQGFEKKFPSGSKYWTAYDDQLIGLLFSKIVNRSVGPEPAQEDMVEEMVNNLFDLCFYINKDVHHC